MSKNRARFFTRALAALALTTSTLTTATPGWAQKDAPIIYGRVSTNAPSQIIPKIEVLLKRLNQPAAMVSQMGAMLDQMGLDSKANLYGMLINPKAKKPEFVVALPTSNADALKMAAPNMFFKNDPNMKESVLVGKYLLFGKNPTLGTVAKTFNPADFEHTDKDIELKIDVKALIAAKGDEIKKANEENAKMLQSMPNKEMLGFATLGFSLMEKYMEDVESYTFNLNLGKDEIELHNHIGFAAGTTIATMIAGQKPITGPFTGVLSQSNAMTGVMAYDMKSMLPAISEFFELLVKDELATKEQREKMTELMSQMAIGFGSHAAFTMDFNSKGQAASYVYDVKSVNIAQKSTRDYLDWIYGPNSLKIYKDLGFSEMATIQKDARKEGSWSVDRVTMDLSKSPLGAAAGAMPTMPSEFEYIYMPEHLVFVQGNGVTALAKQAVTDVPKYTATSQTNMAKFPKDSSFMGYLDLGRFLQGLGQAMGQANPQAGMMLGMVPIRDVKLPMSAGFKKSTIMTRFDIPYQLLDQVAVLAPMLQQMQGAPLPGGPGAGSGAKPQGVPEMN